MWYTRFKQERIPMSFDKLKVADLRAIAESYGAEEVQLKTKKELLQYLDDEGVTYDAHDALANATKATDEEVGLDKRPTEPTKSDDLVLLKMERGNPGYEAIGKYMFTQEHPYLPVPRADANEIFRLETGFRLATDEEVQSFYN
jgi:hypothetical protein